MLCRDLLYEAFPYPPGSEMPANITDYRDAGQAKGRYHTYSKEYRPKSGKPRFWEKAPRTHLVLTKNGGVIVYYYADHNTISYRELLDVLHREVDPMQGDIFGIVVKGNGYLLERSRTTGSWGGDRNRYSTDLIKLVQALKDRGVAGPSTPIWIGNWASGTGEHVGTVGRILGKTDTRQITVYHGTDNFRLGLIMQSGLKALPLDDRVWNKSGLDKVRPAHREESVYLTASRPQAEYYATKAVNIDRKRLGPSKRREIEQKVMQAKRSINQMQAQLAGYDKMTDAQIASHDEWTARYQDRAMTIAMQRRLYPEFIARAQAVIDRASGLMNQHFYDKIEPVILQVTLYRRDFAKLMADDDYLRQNPEAKPEDWQESLSQFGQIAFSGVIPPERLKVIAQGKDAGRVSN